MKTSILLSILFLVIIFYGSVEYSHGIVGLTRLNGDGCVCHNFTPDNNVNVWIEGPDSVQVNQTAVYRLYLSGGPAVGGGYNAAVRTGILNPGDSTSQKIDQELTHTTPKVFAGDTVYWQFTYTAPSAVQWDTIYSVAQSVNLDGIPNSLDKWNFGASFPVKVVPFVPVELISFTAEAADNVVNLNWSTATETNNSGFEVQRKTSLNGSWNSLGFVEGKNNSTERNVYSFTDLFPAIGTSWYRLKQLDLNGSFTYSGEVQVNTTEMQMNYYLAQNYPNPFNPSTTIKFTIPSGSLASLKVYNTTGELVSTLIEGTGTGSNSQVEFNASSLPSGIYLYKLQSGSWSETRKMILIK